MDAAELEREKAEIVTRPKAIFVARARRATRQQFGDLGHGEQTVGVEVEEDVTMEPILVLLVVLVEVEQRDVKLHLVVQQHNLVLIQHLLRITEIEVEIMDQHLVVMHLVVEVVLVEMAQTLYQELVLMVVVMVELVYN